MKNHPLGGTQTEFIREDGNRILLVDHGWECCPHEYIIVEKDPYAQEVKDGKDGEHSEALVQ